MIARKKILKSLILQILPNPPSYLSNNNSIKIERLVINLKELIYLRLDLSFPGFH